MYERSVPYTTVYVLDQVRSFSQLRNEFSDVDTFYLGQAHLGSPLRRSRSRGALVAPVSGPLVDGPMSNGDGKRRARSKSRPRALYSDGEMVRSNGESSVQQWKHVFYLNISQDYNKH